MSTVPDIINLWPSPSDFASDIGLQTAGHARIMRLRRSIPRWYWPAVEAAAQKRGLTVTQETLEAAHRDKRQVGVVAMLRSEGAAA